MTRGLGGKTARRITGNVQEFLAEHGYKVIRTGRSAMAFESFAQTIDVFRKGQSGNMVIRYGICPYNTDCHHLHYSLNGSGEVVPFSATDEELRKCAAVLKLFCEKNVFPRFRLLTDEESLCREPLLPLIERQGQRFLAKLTGARADVLFKKNTAYWRGEGKPRKDPDWSEGLLRNTD